MTNLQILSQEDIDTYENPPILSSIERKKYFRISKELQEVLTQIISPTTQIAFLLNWGYFKASGRFYAIVKSNSKDLDYVIKSLSLSHYDKQEIVRSYTRKLFYRHKKIILELNGKQSFESQKQVVHKQLSNLVDKHLKPKSIFLSLVDWMKIQGIELPTFNYLSSCITKQIRAHEKKLAHLFSKELTTNQKKVLQKLLEKDEANAKNYKLTTLKYIDQSEKPRRVSKSVADFTEIKTHFKIIEPLVKQIEFKPEVWRSYANWVIKARSRQLSDLRNIHLRDLYLTAFLYHQYCYRQDCFIRIFLNVTSRIAHRYTKEEKELVYQKQEQELNYQNLLKNKASSYEQKWKKTCSIIGDNENTAADKIKKIEALIHTSQSLISDIEKQIDMLESKRHIDQKQNYYRWLESCYRVLNNRLGSMLKELEFNKETSSEELIKALESYKNNSALRFCHNALSLFDTQVQQIILEENRIPNIPLCKSLFFLEVAKAIKNGQLNLKYSYKYRSIEEYLLSENDWEKHKEELLLKTGFGSIKDVTPFLKKLEDQLEKQYEKTNHHVSENKHLKINKKGEVLVATPALDHPIEDAVADLLEEYQYISIGDLLFDLEKHCNFLNQLNHGNSKYLKSRPDNSTLIAAIISYGCNIGSHKMGQISKNIKPSTLQTTANWYLNKESLLQSNDLIVSLTKKLPIYKLFRHHRDSIHTSSDGQKYNTAVESLNASYSFKYFGTAKGVSVYSFVDEQLSTFYTTVISASEREASYVLDGLLHNETYKDEDKQWLHHTDTHGQSEFMFAATNLLGISLAPRIKNLKKRTLYAFNKPQYYHDKSYLLIPSQRINTTIIEEEWDNILRLMLPYA